MIIAKIETFALRVPFAAGTHAAASAWGGEGLPAADSLLVKVTTDEQKYSSGNSRIEELALWGSSGLQSGFRFDVFLYMVAALQLPKSIPKYW